MAMPTQEEVPNALKAVHDPAIGINWDPRTIASDDAKLELGSW